MAIVDEFELAERGPEAGPGTPGPRGRRRSRGTPWVVGAVGLVALGIATAVPAQPVAGLGDGPDFGLTDLDLTAPPAVLWESPIEASWVLDARGDRAVVLAQETGSSRTLLGVDLADGEQVWSYDDADGSCQTGSPLVCVQDPGTADAVIVTISLADGDRTTRPHPGALAGITVGDGSMVVVEKTDTIEEDVLLIDADGTEVWHRSADASDGYGDDTWRFLRIADGAVWLDQSQQLIDLRTGVETGYDSRWVLDDGTLLTSDGTELTIGTGEDAVTVSATELLTFHDDDLGGVVRLTSEGNGLLSAQMRATDEELWRMERSPCAVDARVRGVVVVTCWDEADSSTMGIEEVTGEVLWEQQSHSLVEPVARDTLVLSDAVASGLVAIDPRTGTTRWQLPWTGSSYSTSTTPLSNGVLLLTSTSLTRLVWT